LANILIKRSAEFLAVFSKCQQNVSTNTMMHKMGYQKQIITSFLSMRTI